MQIIVDMKELAVFVVFFLSYFPPAFLAETVWLVDGQSCSEKSRESVTLGADGASSTMTISMFDGDSGFLPAVNCNLTVNAPNGRLLLLTFDVIDTISCDRDQVMVHTDSSNKSLCGLYKCPNNNCSTTTFYNTTHTTIQYDSSTSDDRKKHQGFHGTVTAYSLMDPKNKSCPGNNKFKCANDRCIWEGLHCDGHNHCGDNSDEPPGCAKTVWGVLVIALGLVAVCFFLPLFCYLAIWGPRRKVPIRIMGSTFFRGKQNSAINDEESVPILVGQPLQGTMPGETFTFYYGTASSQNPRC